MASDAPNLTITCTPDSSQYDTSGKLTRNDVKVDVEVGLIGYFGDSVTETTEEITSLCSFKHSDCADEINCSWNEDDDLDGSPAFLIHPQTCSLTIEKEGAEPEKDVAQTFLFKVSGGVAPFRVSDLKVSVEGNGSVTITGLPVGEYIVSEEESWGWRYELDKTKSVMAATLSGTTPKATIKAVNSRTNDSWLDGNSWAQNLFGDDGIIVKKKNGN